MKISLGKKIRNYFIAGVVVLIPIGITVYLTIFIVNISSKLIPAELNPNNYLPFSIPGLEILIALMSITIIGGISLSFIGKRLMKFVNDVFKRIPVLRTIYAAIVQMIESFTKNRNKGKSVVLVEYPRKGSWAVGFVTQENRGEIKSKLKRDIVNVFVPTTPNPTSGFLLMFPKDEIIYMDMSFEDASKFIVSAGTSNPIKDK